jgi:bifunctional UDP-N-acetylglucosamine pyrophosphorylase / glucosamine-1-phosphate N-acetyltransferase
MAEQIVALILAAGQGTRMRSKLPKVLHPVGGVAMIAHVVQTAFARHCAKVVVVVGQESTDIRGYLAARFPDKTIEYAVQKEQLGTGHAARLGLQALGRFSGQVLILYGDVPLLKAQTLGRLQRALRGHEVAVLSAHLDDPTGYGRLLRQGTKLVSIVEQRDCSPAQKEIKEGNVGVYLASAKLLRHVLGTLNRNNAQGEYYLTDIVEAGARKGGACAVVVKDLDEICGVNDRRQLARAESIFQHRKIEDLMQRGVRFQDAASVIVDADVRIGRDAVVGVGVQIYGATQIGTDVLLEGPSVIKNSVIEKGAHVLAFSHIENARVRKEARIGPYARLRPEAVIGEQARVGNFVEVKKSILHKGAKVNHLAYIGDATVGPGANIGAGTITCNYDGTLKHPTHIGKSSFIGSNTTLVAPVNIGPEAYVAAGSTVTQDVPGGALCFGRARQKNREGYGKRLRKKLAIDKKNKLKSTRGAKV